MNNNLIKKENSFSNKIKDWINKIKKILNHNKDFRELSPIDLGGSRKNV